MGNYCDIKFKKLYLFDIIISIMVIMYLIKVFLYIKMFEFITMCILAGITCIHVI